ncbi:hypothetical protein [Teredinibacter sp. KSP-S5-2]|uniref:hypothetical protein n=1 Tax=Teredinibacter sp. KSP-S5-2 TaxID=3034506 RepID=UPI002934B2C1|nr:hypothetical protein [Teredinibacter sp. KSP-S5-2]WNO09005.1 hypothetical protein P5V12_18845 [Teredinibacter sp. KSP-S5-2]
MNETDDYDDDNSVEDEMDMDTISAIDDPGSQLSAKERERQKLQEQIDAFLASGGQIQQIDSNVIADPPKKPESNYGGQPI